MLQSMRTCTVQNNIELLHIILKKLLKVITKETRNNPGFISESTEEKVPLRAEG
jgi:hypothetical protein